MPKAEQLEKSFMEYAALVYPGANQKQVMELRRTFYAGLFIAARDIVDGDKADEICQAAYNELERFYVMAEKDIAIAEGREPN